MTFGLSLTPSGHQCLTYQERTSVPFSWKFPVEGRDRSVLCADQKQSTDLKLQPSHPRPCLSQDPGDRKAPSSYSAFLEAASRVDTDLPRSTSLLSVKTCFLPLTLAGLFPEGLNLSLLPSLLVFRLRSFLKGLEVAHRKSHSNSRPSTFVILSPLG